MSGRRQAADCDPLQVDCVVSYTGATVSVTVHPHYGSDRLASPHLTDSNGGVSNGSGELKELLMRQSASSGRGTGGRINSSAAASGGGGAATPAAAVAPSPLTVRDLSAAVCRQLFGFSSSSTTTINIVAGASHNSLKDDVALEPLLGQELFLFFDPRLLPKVQMEMPTTDHQLGALIRRQREAVKMMNTPLRTYFDRLQQETDFLMAEHRVVDDSLLQLARRLPTYMDPLKTIRLIEDPTKTLADMVNHGEKRLKQSTEWLEKTTQALTTRRRSVDAAKETLETILQGQSDLLTCSLRVAIEELQIISRGLQKLNLEKHHTAKVYMRTVSESREAVEKDRQGLKLIRQGLLNWLNMDMLKDLPKAYDAALKLATQRLIFYTAVKRVNSTLAYEAADLQLEVDAFVKEWGTRFPQNILPELTSPVSAGRLPRDTLAVLLEQNILDADEDPASDLLARLGLAGTGQPQSARGGGRSPLGSTRSKEEKEKVSSQITALSAELDKVMAEKVHLQDELNRANTQVEQVGREMVQVATEFATKEEGFRSVIQALQGEHEQRHSASSSAATAGSGGHIMSNVHLPAVLSNATLMSDSGCFDVADQAVVNAGVCNRSFHFLRLGNNFIANATYGSSSVGVTLVIANYLVEKLGLLQSKSPNFVQDGAAVRCDVIEVSEDTPPNMGRCRIVKVIVTLSSQKNNNKKAVSPHSSKVPVLPE